MNKRIDELFKQAYGFPIDKLATINLEKFAELIVRECADVVEKNLYQNIGWNTSRAVQRHFGLGPEE
jgi:hypothetical protein